MDIYEPHGNHKPKIHKKMQRNKANKNPKENERDQKKKGIVNQNNQKIKYQ